MKKILIVEDEVIAAISLEDMLASGGYEISGSVTSGVEALESAAANIPDMILMDINIQGPIKGLEVARSLAEKGIPIIFMTGYFDSAIKEEAEALDPVAYFIKPLAAEAIKTTIDRFFRK